jgi:cadmium resistance protein CadD (predicted permease)
MAVNIDAYDPPLSIATPDHTRNTSVIFVGTTGRGLWVDALCQIATSTNVFRRSSDSSILQSCVVVQVQAAFRKTGGRHRRDQNRASPRCFTSDALLVVVSIVALLVSLILAPPFVGLLGVLPILIGVKKLFELRRASEIETRADDPARGGSFGQIASVAVVTVANGGDNLGIYAALSATQSAPAIAVMVIVFAAMTALWITIAYRLVSHPMLGAPIRRYGHFAVPFMLMGARRLWAAQA